MLFGYSFQIFADFAGYSLIAIGISRLFGYDLNMNFNFPYISQQLKSFGQDGIYLYQAFSRSIYIFRWGEIEKVNLRCIIIYL